MSAAPHAQDVIFDGTMMWAPFVEQTIAMVRDHRHKYRRGPGYHKSDGCNVERRASSNIRVHVLVRSSVPDPIRHSIAVTHCNNTLCACIDAQAMASLLCAGAAAHACRARRGKATLRTQQRV